MTLFTTLSTITLDDDATTLADGAHDVALPTI